MNDIWEVKKLGETAVLSSGNSAPQNKELFEDGKYPFFRTSDIGQIHIGEIANSRDYLNEKGIKGMRLFPKGTILVPKSGASTFLNHRVILGVDGFVSSHLATVNPNQKILDGKFLFYFLTTVDSKTLIQDIAYPSLKISDIGKIDIAFPPLPEQQRIVAILDEAFAAIAQAKENAEKNLQNARELFDSFSQSIFENKGEDLLEEKMVDACKIITCGVASTPKYVDESVGVPFLSAQNVRDGEVVLDKYKFISQEFHEQLTKKNKPSKGDVLYSRVGAKFGEAGVVEHDFDFSVYVSLTLIRPKAEKLNSYYLKYYLNSQRIKALARKTISSSGVPNLNVNDVREFPVKYPSLTRQKEIINNIRRFSVETKKLENIYRQKINDLDELKKSILQKAFNGELK
jgi:type I restriction enzyme S subunit